MELTETEFKEELKPYMNSMSPGAFINAFLETKDWQGNYPDFKTILGKMQTAKVEYGKSIKEAADRINALYL